MIWRFVFLFLKVVGVGRDLNENNYENFEYRRGAHLPENIISLIHLVAHWLYLILFEPNYDYLLNYICIIIIIN